MGSSQQPQFDAAKALAKHEVRMDEIPQDVKSVNDVLSKLYPKRVISSSLEQQLWKQSYWSMHQREANPSLVFQPASAQEVAVALILCRAAQCKFSVKSGGHAAMRGASSADGGVTIDLANLNGVVLNENKSIASIGAGNRWEYVFKELDKYGVGVAGGRAGDVGAGGYTLGGGISFFASAQGWGCDNVRNYELVTADGEILNVTYESYPDLFWALRGGGPNFGIVTRFDYETFPQTDIFAGSMFYDYEHKDAVIKAFNTYSNHGDPKAATWLSIVNSKGKKLMSALAMYADPHPDAKVLQPYLSIPSIGKTAKVRSMADMVHEIAEVNVKDHRQNYTNHTFKFDSNFVSWLADMFWEEMEDNGESFETKQGCILLLQFITKEAVTLMQRNGGNCLSLKPEEAPYLNVLMPSAWCDEKDDEVVMSMVKKIFDLAITEGKRRELYVDYIYMNYASAHQDVLKGYGEENYNQLKAIAEKYDPEGVFQKLRSGYFKFGGAPGL
ncbi:FAD binding domain protein [Setomelanomma holmii]|uniref:FAD binding domain protein n=1 Tax=Setomelanomma holmii TaxID=210430 RepID=A0A9P4H3H7_9PLEO|nr:FAD binding domain protein [Setomelanomma holmii]